MSTTEIFLILGINPVKDERVIKNAYREKLAVTNPEDDPEGFKRLRQAYEEACVYAKTPDGEENDGAEAERDTTPSGLWLERAAAVYADIHSRQDEKLWSDLFADDIFLSLEEEENCRFKLLRFLMDHFRLPTHIWKLLDKKMNLVADAAKLRESFPMDFIGYVVNRCERGEDIEFDVFEGAANAEYDLFINYYDDCWHALSEEKVQDAERFLNEADGLHIYHPAMEVCRGRLMYLQGKKDEAKAFMKALFEKYPKDSMVGYNTAECLWKDGDRAGAAEVYLALKEEHDKHYMANVRLTEWYYDIGEYDKAKKCAEGVLSSGADDNFMEILTKVNEKLEGGLEDKWHNDKDLIAGMELGWCYLQDGKTSKGIRLTKELEKAMTAEKKMEFHGLLAKLYIEQGDLQEAIDISKIWESMLKAQIPLDETEEAREKNEDRVRQARMIRIQCYKMLGYKDSAQFQNAIAEITLAETGTAKDIGLLLEKAYIYTEMEEYEKALEVTDRLIQEYQVYAAAATAIEAYRRQWEAGGVVQNARLCIDKFPAYIRAYEHLGRVYLDLKEYELLKELLELAKQNGVESPYFEAFEYQMNHEVPEVEELNKKLDEFDKNYQDRLDDGEFALYEKGLPIITEYMYWFPGAYMFRRRASFHVSGQQLEKALADYEKALAEEPADPYVFTGMSNVYRLMGNYEQALVCMKKAMLYAESDLEKALNYHTARIYMLLGDDEMALFWMEKYEKAVPDAINHLKCMSECLARLGRVEDALDKVKSLYTEGDPAKNGYYKAVAEVYRMAGKFEDGLQATLPWIKKMLKGPLNMLSMMAGKVDKDAYIDMLNSFAWYALVCGKKKEALDYLTKQVKNGLHQRGKYSDEGLEDMIFAAILFEEHEVGAQFAKILKSFMEKADEKAVDEYFDRPKGRLTREFLAGYYTLSDEELQQILDKESKCAICSFCLMPLCKELEAMRILLLIKQGKIAEAKERLEHNLKVQPYDEYMQAIAAVLN